MTDETPARTSLSHILQATPDMTKPGQDAIVIASGMHSPRFLGKLEELSLRWKFRGRFMSVAASCRNGSSLRPLASALQCSPTPRQCEGVFANQLAHHLGHFREEGPGRPYFVHAWATSP